MALTTVQKVEDTGKLTPYLFQVPDQTTLDSFVTDAINYADAWMQGHMGSNYGLSQFTWQVTLQERGQRYLALEAIVDSLKSLKTYGTHAPYMSEESASYENLIQTDWGQQAMASLDLWVTVEQITRNFAMPLLLTSAPIIESDCLNTGLDPLEVQYAALLDRARGISVGDIGTVTR